MAVDCHYGPTCLFDELQLNSMQPVGPPDAEPHPDAPRRALANVRNGWKADSFATSIPELSSSGVHMEFTRLTL